MNTGVKLFTYLLLHKLVKPLTNHPAAEFFDYFTWFGYCVTTKLVKFKFRPYASQGLLIPRRKIGVIRALVERFVMNLASGDSYWSVASNHAM